MLILQVNKKQTKETKVHHTINKNKNVFLKILQNKKYTKKCTYKNKKLKIKWEMDLMKNENQLNIKQMTEY